MFFQKIKKNVITKPETYIATSRDEEKKAAGGIEEFWVRVYYTVLYTLRATSSYIIIWLCPSVKNDRNRSHTHTLVSRTTCHTTLLFSVKFCAAMMTVMRGTQFAPNGYFYSSDKAMEMGLLNYYNKSFLWLILSIAYKYYRFSSNCR